MHTGHERVMEVLKEVKQMGVKEQEVDFIVDVTLSAEENLIEVHHLGGYLELDIEQAEALGHKLLALCQDYRGEKSPYTIK